MGKCDNCADSRISKKAYDHPLGGPVYHAVGKERVLCDVCFDDLIASVYDGWKP